LFSCAIFMVQYFKLSVPLARYFYPQSNNNNNNNNNSNTNQIQNADNDNLDNANPESQQKLNFSQLNNNQTHITLNYAGEAEMNQFLSEIQFILGVVAIVFIVFSAYMIFLAIKTSLSWNGTENIQQAMIENKYFLSKTSSQKTYFFQLQKKYEIQKLTEQIYYHKFRHRFIQQNNLSPNFDFSEYLLHCFDDQCTDLVSIHYFLWLFVFMLLTLNWTKFKIIPLISSRKSSLEIADITFWIFVPWIIFLFSLALYWKCERVFKEIVDINNDPNANLSEKLLNSKKKKRLFFHFDKYILIISTSCNLIQAFLLVGHIIYFQAIEWGWYFHILMFIPSVATLLIYGPHIIFLFCLISNLELDSKENVLKQGRDSSFKSIH